MGPLPLARISLILFSLKGGVIRLVMFERGFGRVFGPLGVKGVASRPALTSPYPLPILGLVLAAASTSPLRSGPGLQPSLSTLGYLTRFVPHRPSHAPQ